VVILAIFQSPIFELHFTFDTKQQSPITSESMERLS